jgi:hypothetical protein
MNSKSFSRRFKVAKPKPGDLIYVDRYGGIFEHYGIYAGEGKVIHRTEKGVRKTTLDKFCKDSSSYNIERSSNPEKMLKRARARLGEEGYNLAPNNCEHFARWCVGGVGPSVQVDDVAIGTVAIGLGAAIGLGLGLLEDIYNNRTC